MDIKVYRKREFEQREARLKNAEFQKLEKTNKNAIKTLIIIITFLYKIFINTSPYLLYILSIIA